MEQIEQVITSLEVAEMLETEHYKVLRKLEGDSNRKGYIEILGNSHLGVANYFRESTYDDAQGKSRKCYLITKLGCDFLANKFTGEKGIIFTAKYVKRFHDMEDAIQQPKSALDQLRLIQQATLEVDEKVDAVNKDLQDFKMDMPILALEIQKITNAKNRKAVALLGGKQSEAYHDKSLRGKVYSDMNKQLLREFGVDTYKAIKRSQCDKAIEIINSYSLPLVLHDAVNDFNSQMAM